MAFGMAARGLRDAASPAGKAAAAQAVSLLEAAVRDRPDDLPALESLAHAYGVLDRPTDALRVFEQVLGTDPRRELTLRSMGRTLTRLQRLDQAREAIRKAIAVDPWRSEYDLALGQVCFQARNWPATVNACREALRINPELIDARSLLIQSLLRVGDAARAEAEFQTLMRFYPAAREVWEPWFERQKQTADADRGSPGSQP
jgi:tetratricopeptide (TPR) repeat protein